VGTSFRVIAFDGDDTLWHNESIFSVTQEKFCQLVQHYLPEGGIGDRLYATEIRNLELFGYGIKGFTLSMIETAIEVSDGRVTAGEIQSIIGFGRDMLAHPVQLLDGVADVVQELGRTHQLMVITKGDLFDQESKLARSGLSEEFWRFEVVAEKDERCYRRILAAHDIDPSEFMMVGNSMRSDVLPVLALGATAVHIPYHVTWAHELVELDEEDRPGLWHLESVTDLPELVQKLESDPAR
jgi:putative hydrolase of the HAD superfamily